MKKLSLVLIFIFCITMFAGCFNADSITLLENYAQYQTLLENYPYQDEGKIEVFNGQNQYDLYSGNSYTANVFQAIYASNDTSFNLLNVGNEYQVLLQAAMNYFYSYGQTYLTITANNEKVPQKIRTELYYALENLSKKTNDVYDNKMNLETICGDNFDLTDIVVTNALKKYLTSYQELIGSAIKMDLIFQNLCDTYINENSNITTVIPTGSVQEQILKAQIHIADYLYNKYMVFDNDVTATFKDDELFEKLIDLITSLNNVSAEKFIAISNDSNAVVLFKKSLEIQSHFDQEFKNIYSSVEKLNHKIPSENSNEYSYYKYLADYETTMLTYSGILNNIVYLAQSVVLGA